MPVHAKNLIGIRYFERLLRTDFVELLQWHINEFCFDPQRAKRFCAAQLNWPMPFALRWGRDPSRS